MEQINFSEHSRAVHFGHRKLTPRACVIDSKKHLRLFLSDALEDLGFVTSECGQAGDLAGVLPAGPIQFWERRNSPGVAWAPRTPVIR